jgi:hypothetical protein
MPYFIVSHAVYQSVNAVLYYESHAVYQSVNAVLIVSHAV